MKEKITLALAQISSQRENKKENLRKIEELTMRAKKEKADLVIFPELSLTGYVVRDQVYELAETIPGPSTTQIAELTRKTGMYVVFGMPEGPGRFPVCPDQYPCIFHLPELLIIDRDQTLFPQPFNLPGIVNDLAKGIEGSFPFEVFFC